MMANEMKARHLVTDNPQDITESMLNFAYVKNEKVYLRYANGIEDIDLCEYVSQLTMENGCNLSADNIMQGYCIDGGCECEVSTLYVLAIQAAELRERLKHYESLEERGLLQTVPCKIGDTVYVVCEDDEGNFIQENKVTEVCAKGFWVSCYVPPENDMGLFESYEDIGKTIFFAKEKAEQKLKEISYEQTDKSSG